MAIHKKIINHVRKHHHKYLFGAGVAFGIGALKVMALLGLFVGIQATAGRLQAADESIRIHKQLEVFSLLDDFMHRKFNETSVIPDPKREEHDKKFLEADQKYHAAKNMNERYKAAEELLILALTGEKLLQELGYTQPEDILYFNELVYQFYQIE